MKLFDLNSSKLYAWKICLILGFSLSCNIFATEPVDTDTFQSEYKSLNHEHRAFSENFHHALLQQTDAKPVKFQTIKPLNTAVRKLQEDNKKLLSGNIIIQHIPMLKYNYDNLAIFDFIDILLEQNEWNSAELLFDWIKREGDSTIISNIAYIFAKYEFQQQHWRKTLEHLDGNINDLPHEDYHHALLIKGISLQQLEKHRSALSSYRKIPTKSKYYISARLNMAIANIRQGWWTDGHILIEDVLKRVASKRQEEPLNRLYLTLGYSLFNQEYYRNSRDAFRNVGQKSQYTNKALLGLALTAASQEDFIGALNAVRILKEKQSYDLPVDESYLLMPYFYEKLQQDTTATSGYTEAVSYYQKRIKEIKAILQSGIDISLYTIHKGTYTSISINDNPINFSLLFPDYLFDNYAKLDRYPPLLSRINDQNLNNEFKNLKSHYKRIIEKMVQAVLNKRIEHLNSYMDQSRYGLARLYDNNLVSKK